MDCENCVFFLVRNVLVYTAESQTSHSEITESISDKQNQISKAHPAVGLGAVSQHLLEANGTGESFSKNPALRPDTADREHINKKIDSSAEGCSSKALPAASPHFLLNP